MAFGQANGYPATHSQMDKLNELILEAGHTDFRDARGPLGLTQRQAGGKFTRDEADELIAQLEADVDGSEAPEAAEAAAAPTAAKPKVGLPRGGGRSGTGLARVPSEKLAAELQSRGWIVVEP